MKKLVIEKLEDIFKGKSREDVETEFFEKLVDKIYEDPDLHPALFIECLEQIYPNSKEILIALISNKDFIADAIYDSYIKNYFRYTSDTEERIDHLLNMFEVIKANKNKIDYSKIDTSYLL